jgi:hypothetical protein
VLAFIKYSGQGGSEIIFDSYFVILFSYSKIQNNFRKIYLRMEEGRTLVEESVATAWSSGAWQEVQKDERRRRRARVKEERTGQ